jgi:hypothetical protein
MMFAFLLFILVVSPLLAQRAKREGFGPWEAQETWDDKGKPYMDGALADKILQVVEEVKQVIANASLETEIVANEIREAIEHPLDTMTHSKLGLGILAIITLVLFVAGIFILKLLWPIIAIVLRCMCFPFSLIVRAVSRTTCCMLMCATTPFISLRNWFIRYLKKREASKYDEEMEVVESDGPIQIKRIYSRLRYDDNGVYVAADENTRVYIDDEADQIKAHLVREPKRVNGDLNFKETMIVRSVPRTTDKLPDFQGVFKIDDTVIGHYSCLRYHGEICLLTAYHVLEYNQNSIIKVCKGKFEIELSQVRADILSCSPSEKLDYIVLRVPPPVLSKLQLKVGKISERLAMGSGVAIFQYMDNKPVYTRAIPVKSEKPWHIKYPASTIVGSSGAPILDIHHRIVGVHVEASPDGLFNVGVVPPFFREYGKESPTNTDVLASAPAFEEMPLDDFLNQDWDYSEFEDYEEEMHYIEFTPRRGEDVNQMTWAEQMRDLDENRQAPREDRRVFRMKTVETEKGRVQHRIKGDRFRKESPWSCSKCGLLHLKAGYNCKACGYALRKPLTESDLEETEAAVQTSLPNLPAELIAKISEMVVSQLRKQYNFENIVEKSLNMDPASWNTSVKDRKKNAEDLKKQSANLPKKVAMTKQLAQALDTKPVQPYTAVVKTKLPYSSHEVKDTLVVANSVRVGKFGEKDPYFTVAKGANTKLDKTVKETVVPEEKKRRPRRKRTSENSLNSQAPLRGGAHGVDGSMDQNLSQTSPDVLDDLIALLEARRNKLKQKSGKQQLPNSQSSTSTAGPVEAPPQRK